MFSAMASSSSEFPAEYTCNPWQSTPVSVGRPARTPSIASSSMPNWLARPPICRPKRLGTRRGIYAKQHGLTPPARLGHCVDQRQLTDRLADNRTTPDIDRVLDVAPPLARTGECDVAAAYPAATPRASSPAELASSSETSVPSARSTPMLGLHFIA